MTSIDFHFNVADKTSLIVQLVGQALARRLQVTIALENEANASQLSQQLWQNEHTSFLPNVAAQHAHAVHTPVLLHWGQVAFTQDEWLINLNAQQHSAFSRFKHLVELVGLDEQDKTQARARYKFYRDRGYSIRNIDYLNLPN